MNYTLFIITRIPKRVHFILSRNFGNTIQPFGVGGVYRYGFNGKENDNEIKGEGNQQDYGMRIYDPRVGRFLSVDPITKNYPELTPYQFASNRPIDGIDQDGLEFLGSGYIVDELSKGASKLGMLRVAGFLDSYGHSVIVDPVYSAHNVVKTAKTGDVWGTVKQFDPTGISSIPDIVETAEKAKTGDPYAQGQSLGIAVTLFGGGQMAKANGVKFRAEIPEGAPKFHTAGFSFESISAGFSQFANKLGKCVEYTRDFAKKYSKTIQKEGGQAKAYEINIGQNGLIGTYEKQYANTGMHRFTEVTINGETRIYDNFNTEGVPKAEYMKNLGGYKNGVEYSGEDLLKNHTKEVKP